MNIFAFTETSYRPSFYPGYISINKERDGALTISVRERGNDTNRAAHLDVAPETLEHLAAEIMAFFGAQEPSRTAHVEQGGEPVAWHVQWDDRHVLTRHEQNGNDLKTELADDGITATITPLYIHPAPVAPVPEAHEQRLAAIREHGDQALIDAVLTGKTSIHAAHAIAKFTPPATGSIGDDAEFWNMLNLCFIADGFDDKIKARRALASYIDARTPAGNTSQGGLVLTDERIQNEAAAWQDNKSREVCTREQAYAMGMERARAILAAPPPPAAVAPACDYFMPDGRLCPKCGSKHEAQPVAPEQADDLKFNATRLRNVCRLVGIESAVPEDDATLDGARGAVLGQIARALRKPAAPPQDTSVRDAERYRWLRHADLDALAAANWGKGEVYEGAQFDAAIDAAMGQSSPPAQSVALSDEDIVGIFYPREPVSDAAKHLAIAIGRAIIARISGKGAM